MQAVGAAIRVCDETSALRRRVGPLAWCALEVLVERADGLVVDASVRTIAAELGVAKNTAHRALAALTRAGVIAPMQDRDATGRFSVGRYRLHLDDLIGSTPPRPSRTRSRRAQHQTFASQLSLLELT